MSDQTPDWKLGTLAIHGGFDVDPATGSQTPPIYQTASYKFSSSAHAASLFALEEFGNIYTRIGNPTCDALERRIAAMDGGVAALALASGSAAITCAVLNICGAGDEIVSASAIYGGTFNFFEHTLSKLGIKTHFVDVNRPEAFAEAINDKTKLVFVETIGNPKLDIPDFQAIAKVAHDAGLPLFVDNTVATPVLFKPIDHGADVVLYSATKYLGGHGTTIGGLIVDSGTFDWAASGRFPMLTEPDEGYHGMKYVETFGGLAFILRCRTAILRDTGACQSPMNAFLIMQGIETLHLRMPRHCENALEVARFLKDHPMVAWVNYPGLDDHPSHALAQRYLPAGASGIVGFGIKGGKAAGVKLVDKVKLASHLANIGDAKTLIIHPASTTHQQLTDEEQLAGGVTPDFLRLCVGIEDVEDIKADLDQAMQ